MEYSVRVNRRAKRMIVTVYPDGCVTVTTPRTARPETVARFVHSKRDWIENVQQRLAKRPSPSLAHTHHTKAEIARYKARALVVVQEQLAYFNAHYGLKFSKITIRNQKTRWGSCSRKGALSFNYRIALMPQPLAAYVVVHELCHVQHMNHSSRFWKLVAQTIPDYAVRRRALRAL